MSKKYMLASFLVNCSNRLMGTKLYQVYLEVFTTLFLMFLRLRRAFSAASLKSILRIYDSYYCIFTNA